MITQILDDLITSINGAQAAIFLDDDGEAISQAGNAAMDIKLIGAWKEIQLDHIKDISGRLGLGGVQAVLYSLDQGTELVVPVSKDYCLLVFLSNYSNMQEAMAGVRTCMERLKKEIE